MLPQCLILAALFSSPPGASPAAAESIHAPFDALLKAHVRNDLVDYDAFARSPDFQTYLQALSQTPALSLSRADQAAFWINAYNAYTIELINRHKERESIRNVNKILGVVKGGKGPWKEDIVKASLRVLTLEDVERMLRRDFKDPRILLTLARAAISSPPLRGEAYEGSRLEEQLHDQTRTFLRDRQTENRLDLGNQIVHLSAVFDWYRDDFGKTDAAILKFLAPYFEGKGERSAFAAARLTIVFNEFDWSLNLLRPRETP